jgi:hypothetical protein
LAEGPGSSVETVSGAVFYPHWAPAAQLLAGGDSRLDHLKTVGAAFIALAALKLAQT